MLYLCAMLNFLALKIWKNKFEIVQKLLLGLFEGKDLSECQEKLLIF